MTLAELLQKLSYGQLVDLSIAGEGSGVVPPANIPKLVLRINDALTHLYTRFPLQLRTIILGTVDGIFNYTLAPQYAQTSASTEINKYILDSVANPFLDDVLMITNILGNVAALPKTLYNHPYGKVDDKRYMSLGLNDSNDELSWFLPSYDTMSMDYPKTGDTYFVQYKAKHAPIPLVPVDTSLVQIRIPSPLETALLSHVAGTVYSGMGSDVALTKSQQFMAMYEAECAFHETHNTFNKFSPATNIHPIQRGWA